MTTTEDEARSKGREAYHNARLEAKATCERIIAEAFADYMRISAEATAACENTDGAWEAYYKAKNAGISKEKKP